MKRAFPLLFLSFLALHGQKKTAKPAAVVTVVQPEQPAAARAVVMNDRQTIVVKTKVRFDTWIVLPEKEYITEAGTGDPENWSIKAADEKHPTNLVHVKPAEPNGRTNLHLRTTSGHIYSFLLTEVSNCPVCEPDLKVFVDPPAPDVSFSFQPAAHDDQREKIAELQRELISSRKEVSQAKRDATLQVAKETAAFRAAYPLSLRCDYTFKFNRAPFFVEAICSDGLFTYIKSGAEEMPSLYMEKDGKPALVKFDFRTGAQAHEGTYIIDSVMTRGYLQLGKRKLKFQSRS